MSKRTESAYDEIIEFLDSEILEEAEVDAALKEPDVQKTSKTAERMGSGSLENISAAFE